LLLLIERQDSLGQHRVITLKMVSAADLLTGNALCNGVFSLAMTAMS